MAHIITATNFGKRPLAIIASPDRLSRVRWSVNFGGLPIFTPRDLARLSCHTAPSPYPLVRGKDGPADQKLKR
jgi:hypothetical protein